MTHRTLIVAATASVVVAILAVALVAVHKSRSRAPVDGANQARNVTAPEPSTSQAEAVQPTTAAAPRTIPAPESVAQEPADIAAETGDDETASEDQEPADHAVLATSDPEAFVKTLSDRQNAELYRLLRERSARRYMREARYNLTTDTRLQFMAFGGNNKLALTEDQRARIAEIKQNYKPQMDSQLRELWARQEEVNRQVQEAYRGMKTPQDFAAFREANLALLQEQQDIMRQIGEVSQPLDEQYLSEIRPILTDEQAKALDGMPAFGQGGHVQVIGGGGGGPVIIQPSR